MPNNYSQVRLLVLKGPPEPLWIQESWLIHTARDRDRDREKMGFYIMLCTVHTTQGQGQSQGTTVFYCAHHGACLGPSPGPVQCE